MKNRILALLAAVPLALGCVAIAGTPLAPAPPASAASYVSCYLGMDGYYYCWRYACTPREEMAGCYEGWVRRGTIWA